MDKNIYFLNYKVKKIHYKTNLQIGHLDLKKIFFYEIAESMKEFMKFVLKCYNHKN